MTQIITGTEYTKQGFVFPEFLQHVKDYRSGKREDAPRLAAPSHLARPPTSLEEITFEFTDDLLDEVIRNKYPRGDLQRDLSAALTYGFVGTSHGGKNGIVLLKKEDTRMNHKTAHYLSKNYPMDTRDYEGVKIVTHRMNGLRTIGIRHKEDNHAIFFDRMNYKA